MMISEEDRKYLLSLKVSDLTFNMLVSLFSKLKDNTSKKLEWKPARFRPQDTMELRPIEYFVTTKIVTTVGAFIYNKYIIEGSGVQDVTGYIDWEITDGGNSKVEKILSLALIQDKITMDQFTDYINRRDNLGQQLHAVICSSFTMNILKTPKEVVERKKELLEKNKDKLENGDIKTAVDIEHELLGIAKEKLKDDPAIDLYISGARGSFNNNYKNNNIIKGPVFNNITGKYDVLPTSYMEGIRKEDIPTSGNGIIAGAYPSAVGTQIAGYFTKQIMSALQTEVLGEKDSDCGSKRTIPMLMTPNNTSLFLYRYIVVGESKDNLVELTPETIDSYIGQTVNLRSPMCCTGEKLCNKCAGNLYYKLGTKNVGLTSCMVSSVLLKLKLKAKHDSTAQIFQFNPDNLLI